MPLAVATVMAMRALALVSAPVGVIADVSWLTRERLNSRLICDTSERDF